MKNSFTFLHFLSSDSDFVEFRPRTNRIIIVLLLLFNVIATAQETPVTNEFPIGSTFGSGNRTTEALYDSYTESGMNMIEQYATDSTRPHLLNYNLNAANMDREQDWIYFYSSSFYSKWQAEEDQDTPYVGVKHKYGFGEKRYWGDAWCWSTIGVTTPGDSLLFGPHYHQEKWYRRWLYATKDPIKMNGIYDVRYIPRWRMALDTTNSNIDPDEDVCRLSVWVRHVPIINGVWNDSVYDHILKESQTLKVSDFPANGQFDYFYLDNDTTWYRYPEEYQNPGEYYKLRYPDIPDISDTVWEDVYGNNGVEFRVEWLRSDAKCTIYVDYVEVYDEYGWKDFIDDPEGTAEQITSYADSFKTMGWSNIKHWVGATEPYTIDSYIPIRIVDSLLRDNGTPPLMVQVYPYWNVKINEDSQLVRYYKTAKPDPLAIHFFPFNSWNVPSSYGDWDAYRTQLQISYTLTGDKGFWYQAQNFGFELPGGGWLGYRQPDSSEHKAEIMLALTHGIKGLVFAHYDSYPQTGYTLQGLVRDDPPYYTKTELWYLARDNIIPRLKGTLGKTLLKLDYTGNFLQLKHIADQWNPSPSAVNYDYLTLDFVNPPNIDHNWHSGFFDSTGHPLDNYFMLDNLITTGDRSIIVTIDPPEIENYPNYRFRNVEGLFDTTMHTDNFTMQIDYEAGEGYLYQVAPVVKYGGKLIYNETISSTTTLIDEMVIQNGATLTINSTYNADRDIRIKAGGRITTINGGTLKFYTGHKLIVEGPATLSGTASHKLIIDFMSPENGNGIVIRQGSTLNISYCEVKNAVNGITWELDANYLNAQNIDFIDCDSLAINILGRRPAQGPTPPIPLIKNCTITNSITGISVANLSQILIQQNTLNGTDLGLILSNVTTPSIIGNILNGNFQMSGIFLESCNGIVRGNQISSHTNGIHLGNSSPDIGGNTIDYNWNRGLYVGTGSLPNMIGKLVQDPINPILWYAVSGYNKINENGGRTPDDDGSEIFINGANALLGTTRRDGCNQITDQRIPNAEDTPPLYYTQLLMNCIEFGVQIEVQARGNFWDEHPIYPLSDRFGGSCTIYYLPVKDQPCPLPDGSGGKLYITSSSGEIIDTLYAEEREIGELTETEELYAQAEENFLTADYNGAESIYTQIISGNDSLSVKLDAYRRLFEIGKLTGKDENYFTGLRESFLSFASSTDDSLLAKIFDQLSTLSLVANQEYVPAINELDEIIQQNPNTEEAVYAEIDALTAALLVDGNDSTMQKGRLGKYLVKSSGDYNSKLDGLLRKHFGRSAKETEKEILPTEYTLYQNFPNPFNPTTTIKYDLPNTSDVSLIIYDILGRKVKELVNTKQQAGRYEIKFSASTLASGVYIYQLIADKFISSKKMILLK